MIFTLKRIIPFIIFDKLYKIQSWKDQKVVRFDNMTLYSAITADFSAARIWIADLVIVLLLIVEAWRIRELKLYSHWLDWPCDCWDRIRVQYWSDVEIVFLLSNRFRGVLLISVRIRILKCPNYSCLNY